MLNLVQIDRLAEQGAWERLIERVLQNGRGNDLLMRLCLTREEAIAPAAIGLALQRVCELTYGPTGFGFGLVAQLLHLQREDGSFMSADIDTNEMDGVARRSSPAATAIAIRALLEWKQQCASTGYDFDPRIDVAIERGLFSLACRQREDGGFSEIDAESALVLWQLGGKSEFRRAVRFHDLVDVVDAGSSGDEVVSRTTVSRLAQAAAA